MDFFSEWSIDKREKAAVSLPDTSVGDHLISAPPYLALACITALVVKVLVRRAFASLCLNAPNRHTRTVPLIAPQQPLVGCLFERSIFSLRCLRTASVLIISIHDTHVSIISII